MKENITIEQLKQLDLKKVCDKAMISLADYKFDTEIVLELDLAKIISVLGETIECMDQHRERDHEWIVELTNTHEEFYGNELIDALWEAFKHCVKNEKSTGYQSKEA